MHGVGGVYWILLRAKFFSGNAGSEKRHYAHKYMTCKSKKESVVKVIYPKYSKHWLYTVESLGEHSVQNGEILPRN